MTENITSLNERIAKCVDEGKLDEAKSLAERMKASHGVEPDTATLDLLLGGFVKEKRMSDANACLEQFTTMFSIIPSVGSLLLMIEEVLRSDGAKDASDTVLSLREKFTFILDSNLIHRIAKLLLDAGDPMLAAEFISRECTLSGVGGESVLCQEIASALVRSQHLDKAKDFVIRCPSTPTCVIVSQLVDRLVQAGRVDEATQFAAQVWAKYHVAAEMATVRLILETYLRQRKYDHAIRLVKAMKQYYGVHPQAYVCNLVVHALVKVAKLKEARDLVTAMPDLGVQPSCITLSSLVAGYAKIGHFEEAKTIVRDMEKVWGVSPEIVTYNGIISALCRSNRLEEACEYLGEVRVPLGVRTFGPLLLAAMRNNDARKTRELWDLMKKEHVLPDVFIWNARLRAEAATGTSESFEEIYEELKRSGVKVTNMTMQIVDEARADFRSRGAGPTPHATEPHTDRAHRNGHSSHTSAYSEVPWTSDRRTSAVDTRLYDDASAYRDYRSRDAPRRDHDYDRRDPSYDSRSYLSSADAYRAPPAYTDNRRVDDRPPSRSSRHRTPLYGDVPSSPAKQSRYEPYPARPYRFHN